MPIGPARMPLMDHLGELRRRLMICIVSLLCAAIFLYMITPQIIEFLINPIKPYLGDSSEMLVVLTPLGGFTIRFKVAIFAALIVCAPVTLWEFMAFLLPALKPNERKWVLPTFTVGVILFIVGTIFCYFIILDPAFYWMLGQTENIAQVLPDATEYVKLIMIFEIAFGFAFELPLIVFYLIVFNIVPYKKLRAAWRTVYIVLLVISAFITPDASPVTMFLMFAAMAGLYEGALLVSRIVLSKKIAKQSAENEEEMAEMAEKTGLSIETIERNANLGRKGDDSEKAGKSKGKKSSRRGGN